MGCEKKAVMYGLISVVIGLLLIWFGNRTMKIYDNTREEYLKPVSVTVFVVGTLGVAFGILSMLLGSSDNFCKLMSMT
jgi:hypothetical protein